MKPEIDKEDMKPKIDKEMNKLVILGILKKELSRFYRPEMAIHRKNSDIPSGSCRF